ncbi:MAG TPA: hypothetical protein VGN62_03825 [Sphingopyxis sp.]|nr:hypothetical protein [Sphingopyxis sp.]
MNEDDIDGSVVTHREGYHRLKLGSPILGGACARVDEGCGFAGTMFGDPAFGPIDLICDRQLIVRLLARGNTGIDSHPLSLMIFTHAGLLQTALRSRCRTIDQ